MSTEIESLQYSIEVLRQKVFGYEGALKSRIVALYKDNYYTSESPTQIVNKQITGYFPNWEDAHDEIREELRGMSSQLGELTETIESLEARLEQKREKHHKHSSNIHKYKTTISTLEETVNTLKLEGARKASSINNLRKSLTTSQMFLSECKSGKASLEGTVATLEQDLRDHEAQAQLQARDVHEDHGSFELQAKTIGSLQERVQELEEDLKVSKQKKVVSKADAEHAPRSEHKAVQTTEPATTSSAKFEDFVKQFKEMREKDVEEATAAQILANALSRAYKQVDEKDAQLESVSKELSDLKSTRTKEEQRPDPKAENSGGKSSNASLQELLASVAEQALEIRGLRSHLQRTQKLGGSSRNYKKRSTILSPQPEHSSRSHVAAESLGGESAHATEANPFGGAKKVKSGVEETESESSGDWHDVSEIVEETGEDTTKAEDLLDLGEE